jgi:hypothetical protein
MRARRIECVVRGGRTTDDGWCVRGVTQEWPKCDAAKAAGIAEKKVAKALKEGGKKGVEIEGAADMSGLTCFCTRMTEAGDNLALLEVSMEGMNAIPDPSNEEERKGCSGHISKLIIGHNDQTNKIAMVAYVADQLKDQLNATEWMQAVCDTDLGGGVGGKPDETSTATWATCVVSEDTENGKFYLKFKDNALTAAIGYLREKGLFQDDSDSESGDNPAADFEW